MKAIEIKQKPLAKREDNETNIEWVARNLRHRGYISRNETKNGCYRLGARIWDLRHLFKWKIEKHEGKINGKGIEDCVYLLKKQGNAV